MSSFPGMEDMLKEGYRSTWLRVIREKLEALGNSEKDFGKRCNLVRQAYMEMGHLVLPAAERGSIVQPYFMPWERFWRESPPEFGAWQSIRYYGRMPLYPQYPVLNYFVDFGDPWQRIGIEIDGKSYHDQGKDRRRDEELLGIGWKIFRIPAIETEPEYLGPDDEFMELDEDDQEARLSQWLLETSDGVIRALKTVYYERRTPSEYAAQYGMPEWLGDFFVQLCFQTLDRHRLIKTFDLPDAPEGDGPWKPWRDPFK